MFMAVCSYCDSTNHRLLPKASWSTVSVRVPWLVLPGSFLVLQRPPGVLHSIGLSLLFSCSFTLLYSCSFVYVLFPMLHAPSSFNFFSPTSFLFPPSLAPSPFTGCVLCTYFNPLHLITPPSLAGSPFTCEILPPFICPFPLNYFFPLFLIPHSLLLLSSFLLAYFFPIAKYLLYALSPTHPCSC